MSYKYWCFTDFTIRDYDELPEHVTYMVWQKEECPTTNRAHLQGYVELSKRRGLNFMRAAISDTAAWAVRRGTQEECIAYCTKDDTRILGPWTLGAPSVNNSGQRTDLLEFRDAIRSGKRKREMYDDHFAHMCRYRHIFGDLRKTMTFGLRLDLEVHLYVGPTGLGKTRKAFDNEDVFRTPAKGGTHTWYDGYDGHTVAILDDFTGEMPLKELLIMTDIYQHRVEIKGNYIEWEPKKIIFTSNYVPRKWYKWEEREESYSALSRRFTHVFEFVYDGDVIEYTGDEKAQWFKDCIY